MSSPKFYYNLSKIYLLIVPVVTALLGFTVNNISYKIYLPIWLINVLLMLASCWMLAANCIKQNDKDKKHRAASGFLLLSPWLFYSIFGGMGAPPETYIEWVSNLFEQQVRYSFLIIGGVLLVVGFALLKEAIKNTGGSIFATLGHTLIAVAVTLFILNMSYWHSFLPEVFKTKEASLSNKLPEAYQPVKKLFQVISIVEVSLIYLGTAAFAASLKLAGWFKNGASSIYIVMSLVAFALVALYGFYPEAITKNGFPFYPLMIPAIPFIMPYYIGVNLIRSTEVTTN